MSSSSDSPETSSDEEDDYQGLKMSGTHSLGLNKNYVLSWRRLHAFREFIQNWKDGIIAAFDMDPRSFLPVWDETTPGVIRITVHRNIEGQRELVGFIVHKAKTGTVEIANFNANLSMDDLSIGGSTKRNNDKFAGVHGEGFKVAALVMVRSGIPVRIQSTSANWNFGFNGVNKDRFYCKISKPNTRNVDYETASLTQQTMGGTLRSDLVSYSSRDVTIQLSHPATGRGYRNPITADEFRGWTTVSLDLSNPDPHKMIRTQHGDLVLDERFAGQIYLKGFKVSAPTLGSKSYRFCYNFATGKLGRDRERMTSHDKEAETLANIWETAVAGDHGNLVQRYVELFSEDCVDIISAEKASRILARRIWTWLTTSQPGAFYYSEGSDSKHDGGHQVDIILNDIKRQPRKLSKELWRLLVKYDCARTPQQERIRLFSSSQPVGNVDGYFGLNISRILKSVLAMDTALSGIQLQFVQGADTTIDLHFDPKSGVLQINHRWLNFEAVHVETPCEFFEIAKHDDVDDIFYCDHVVEDLLELAMNHIRDYVDISPSKAIELRRQAREYIRQTPRGVQVSTTSKAGELQVHWLRNNYEMVSRKYLEKKVCNVKLHSLSTCETKREDLIINTEHLSSARCECPSTTVPLSQSCVLFANLDPNEDYFPVVWREGETAFTAFPPQCVRPLDRSEPITPPSGRSHSVSVETESDIDVLMETDSAYDNESSEVDIYSEEDIYSGQDIYSEPGIYSATPQARDDPPVEEGLDRGIDAREEAISERIWQNEEFPQLRSIVLTPRTLCRCEENDMDMFLEFSLYDSRLDIEFEKDRYYEIRDSSQCYPDYIAWVHDVHDGSAGCVQERRLSVTRFSILRQEHLFRGGRKLDESAEIGDLMLHFSSVQHMGEQSDAEVIMIKDITFAKALSTSFRVWYRPVCHTHSCVPANVDGSSTTEEDAKKELSCRFARSVSDETVTITPIIPKHLAREERPERKGFSSSSPVSVFDFTPNVLGPLEGFADAGFNSFAAVGFDPEHSPKIEPELKESFFDPLDIMDSITKSNFDADFQVLQMPPGVFHPNVFKRFSSAIFQLLEKGETVCVNISSLQSFGCARQRYLVNTVASRFPGLAVVPIKLAAHRTEDDELTLITDLIKDLSFLNPRQTESSEEVRGQFICSPSGELGGSNVSPSYVYNHNTIIRRSEIESLRISPSFDLSHLSPEDAGDSQRQSCLTVREIARIQHFKDDFVFYGSPLKQFEDVIAAQPPPVARAIANCIAKCIKSVVERSGGRDYGNKSDGNEIGDRSEGERPNKRRREE
ncbi:hypothetical protein CGCSCA4_v012662 [Colletotrichum siamense]|uniref:Uncharacterized protein n=1 Tax=Colletotrichum siamense TaxID=690259 RepID=A0A9P5BS97_COLSI|nr:hypothetical protein CGCSCA4_v012662 [Colletotrichum siamense]KAF4848355.1 hypothetical protein CGCSCA2_v012366 [Colletotrichum siamense]